MGQIDLSGLDALFGYQLRRASGVVMADLTDRLAPMGLTVVEATLLGTIQAHPGATQSSIGAALGIQRANMAPLIAKLAARGLIDKTRVDGRSQGLSLTQSGLALVEAAQEAVDAHEAKFSACWADMDRAQLFAMLQCVRSR